MDVLFPLKIDIPDINEEGQSYFSYFNYFKTPIIRLNVLFTREAKIEKINFYKNKIYLLGELKKNNKPISVYYIEICDRIQGDIEIKFFDNSLFIKVDNINKGEESFLFNQDLFDKNNEKIDKLNIFDIYEEFEIYYRIHSEKKM